MARRYALVVGISEYQSPLKPLSKPATDAEAVATVLKQFGDFQDVTSLKGTVTSPELIKALRILLLERATNNDVLIYFTGHGVPVVDPVIGKPKAYLATSDTIVTLEGKQVIEARRSVPLDSLNNLIQESQLSSLVMLFDSCHSGDFLERSLVEKTFTAFSTHKDYYLITACRGFEQAYAIKREQHSIFTGALLAGLSQTNANNDGQVTGDRLFECIARELKGSGQEPIRMGYGGLITLVSYQPQPKVVEAIVDETGEPICPYQGLQAFTAEQQAFFFGRQRTVEEIRQRLEERPFVPVIGASGSGKSSVVRAGLMPWLAETGWRILEPIKPGFDPLTALRAVFEPYFKRSKPEIQQLHQLIKSESNPLPALIDRLSSATANSEPEQVDRFLLVVDQFEEVFTLCPDEGDRQRFIELLTGVVELADARLAIVTTMRADFLEPCLRYPVLHELIESQAKFISSPTGVDLRDAIVEPAQRQGYGIEEGLLLKILEDVGKEPGFLPLLEFALTKLWEQRDTAQKRLTLEQYENLRGLTGALDLHAKKVYQYRDFERESPTEQRSELEQEWIKRIFLRLVRTGEAEKDTRQRRPKTELLALAGIDLDAQNIVRELIEDDGGLVQGRLLVTGQEPTHSEPWVDLAHEALLDGWIRFAEWRKADREARRLVDRMEDARREWEQHQRSINFLLPKGLLVQLEAQGENLHPYLTSALQEFYQLSETREQERESAIEWAKSEGALDARATEVVKLLSHEPLLGLARTLQLVRLNLESTGNQPLGAVQNSLHQAIELTRERNRFQGHKAPVLSVAFSPDGQTIVSCSEDRTIRLRNLNGNPIAQPFIGHTATIRSVAFSPDGQVIVSGSEDWTVRLWNLNGTPIGQPFVGHKGWVMSVVFSPDGQTIASSSVDRTILLWDLNGNSIAQPFMGHTAAVKSVAFSPDGQMIVSGSYDRTLRLWNLSGVPIGQPFKGHKAAVKSVAFSPNGQTIVSGTQDGTLRLWDLKGTPVGKPFVREEAADLSVVSSLAFSPDGQTIVSGRENGTLQLWDLRGNPVGQTFVGHEHAVESVAFSPNGQTIVSGSIDQSIRLWDVQSIVSSQLTMRHEDAVRSVAFSSNSKLIVSGDLRGTICLWNTQGTLIRQFFQGHRGSVRSVAFSPNNKLIASGGSDCKIYLWSIKGNLINSLFEGHRDSVESLAFSPNGELIISGSKDGEIRLWDIQGNRIKRFWWNCEDKLRWHQGSVWSVAFHPDSNTIANTSASGVIWLRDIQGNPVGQAFEGHEGAVWSVAFHSNGKLVASGGNDGTVRLWDVKGNSIGQPFKGHEGAVWSVAFHPNGKLIASGGNDGTVRLWDVKGNSIGQPFKGHEGAVRSVAFSPDGQQIVSGSDDHTIRLWTGGTWQDWLTICCNRIRHHPYFTNPQTEEARSAYEVCRRYVWEKDEEC